jgi:inorganic pyrophosphatase
MRAQFCFAAAVADVVFFQPQTGAYVTAQAPTAVLPAPSAGFVPATYVVQGPASSGFTPGPASALMAGLVAGAAFSMRHKLRALLGIDGVETSSSGELLDFKMKFTKDGKPISPWHDIPAYAENDQVNFICEIPKYGLAKMECDTKGENNPIIQDEKKGKARFYHGKIFWNYGFVPQTWENPEEKDETTGCFGDGDPLDVVEIGSADLEMGSITAVKPLGALAMIDDGELDWKLLAINPADPLADKLNDISDVEKLPGVVTGIREWFRWYKTPDGKPLNEFGYDEAALPKAKSMEIIAELHQEWKKLQDGTTPAGKMWLK